MSILIEGYEELKGKLKNVDGNINFAASVALNAVVNNVKKEYLSEFEQIFDKPNMPYLSKAFKIDRSTKSKLEATISIRTDSLGKGTPFINVLQQHEQGGGRMQKKFEKALSYMGHMGGGMMIVPAAGAPLDGFGNIPQSFFRVLMSYFALDMKAGYNAKMTQKKKDKIMKKGLTTPDKDGRRYKTINGKVYFISSGPQGYGGKSSHLPAGVWEKSGVHGSSLMPVMLFVGRANYRKKFNMRATAEKVLARDFNIEFKKAFAEALRTAKWKQ